MSAPFVSLTPTYTDKCKIDSTSPTVYRAEVDDPIMTISELNYVRVGNVLYAIYRFEPSPLNTQNAEYYFYLPEGLTRTPTAPSFMAYGRGSLEGDQSEDWFAGSYTGGTAFLMIQVGLAAPGLGKWVDDATDNRALLEMIVDTTNTPSNTKIPLVSTSLGYPDVIETGAYNPTLYASIGNPTTTTNTAFYIRYGDILYLQAFFELSDAGNGDRYFLLPNGWTHTGAGIECGRTHAFGNADNSWWTMTANYGSDNAIEGVNYAYNRWRSHNGTTPAVLECLVRLSAGKTNSEIPLITTSLGYSAFVQSGTYSPTVLAVPTNPTVTSSSARWIRTGNYLHLSAFFTFSAPGAGTRYFELPNGWSHTGNNKVCGTAIMRGNSANTRVARTYNNGSNDYYITLVNGIAWSGIWDELNGTTRDTVFILTVELA